MFSQFTTCLLHVGQKFTTPLDGFLQCGKIMGEIHGAG
jgi:hypothetical protein